MNNILGYKETEDIRRGYWNALIELRRSHKAFNNSSSEQEQNIAIEDKKLYNYYLSSYIQ